MKKKTKKIIANNWWKLAILLIVLGIIGYLIYLNETGNLKNFLSGIFTINLNQEDLDNLNMKPSGYSCSIDLPSSACVGELVTSTLEDGKNGFCRIAYKYNGGEWTFYGDINTDNDGSATLSDSAGTSGAYAFGAYCIDADGKLCRTNDRVIQINDCGINCIDTDGKNRYTAGHVEFGGDSYYDQCLEVGSAVTEYYCENGKLKQENLACDYGEECSQTRSGGYCRDVEKTWNPGDTVYENSGSGSIYGAEIIQPAYLDLSDYGLYTDGTCRLGMQVQTSWDYANQNCQGLQGAEGLKWDFYDSNGLEYSRTDTNPVSLGVDLHPESHILNWDGQTEWRFAVNKLLNLANCEISYEYSVKIYIYDC